jgi:hypothetical protein
MKKSGDNCAYPKMQTEKGIQKLTRAAADDGAEFERDAKTKRCRPLSVQAMFDGRQRQQRDSGCV